MNLAPDCALPLKYWMKCSSAAVMKMQQVISEHAGVVLEAHLSVLMSLWPVVRVVY